MIFSVQEYPARKTPKGTAKAMLRVEARRSGGTRIGADEIANPTATIVLASIRPFSQALVV